MGQPVKIGIIICDRYKTCAGGKCFRALKNREGAFSRYKNQDVEIVGYTSCGGCPGGNIEYSPDEMLKNGVNVIHLATGFVVGYPPCPYLDYFKTFIEKKFKTKVVIGTHPIPQKYLDVHDQIQTWESEKQKVMIASLLADKDTRLKYN